MSAVAFWTAVAVAGVALAAGLAVLLSGPLRWLGLWIFRSAAGAVALWLLQYPASLFGWHVGVNPWTALAVGALGAPGILLLYGLQALLR